VATNLASCSGPNDVTIQVLVQLTYQVPPNNQILSRVRARCIYTSKLIAELWKKSEYSFTVRESQKGKRAYTNFSRYKELQNE